MEWSVGAGAAREGKAAVSGMVQSIQSVNALPLSVAEVESGATTVPKDTQAFLLVTATEWIQRLRSFRERIGWLSEYNAVGAIKKVKGVVADYCLGMFPIESSVQVDPRGCPTVAGSCCK